MNKVIKAVLAIVATVLLVGTGWLVRYIQNEYESPWNRSTPANVLAAVPGQVILLAREGSHGAFTFQSHTRNSAIITGCYRVDGVPVLGDDACAALSATVGTTVNMGPLCVGWSYADQGMVWLYLQPGTAVCVTPLRSWQGIDASEELWRYVKYTVPVSSKATVKSGFSSPPRDPSQCGKTASLVAAYDIPNGSIIGRHNLALCEMREKRPAGGLSMADATNILGKITIRDIKRGQPIRWTDVGCVEGVSRTNGATQKEPKAGNEKRFSEAH